MTFAFYLFSCIAILATAMVVTSRHPVHGLLYLVVSFLAVASIFYVLGAPFIALLEVIVYAGAIMVLFVFMIMMLNLGPNVASEESQFLRPSVWVGPSLLCLVLFVEMIYVVVSGEPSATAASSEIDPKQVGVALIGKYYLAVEFASMLLLAGIVAAYHLGKRSLPDETVEEAIQ
ncbi:MAG: NADH-quinone oxidoreductase subunit J [Candidatus Omnitrophica bacterium]|nr:NADH-quinone oxidoreductase subunit J [Candidatus Omnitrophota bacterium]